MKQTLKRSLIDKKALERSEIFYNGGGGNDDNKNNFISVNNDNKYSNIDAVRRRSLDSTAGSVAMEKEMESAEMQLKDLEEQLRANALKRADIDSQLNGFLSQKKFH